MQSIKNLKPKIARTWRTRPDVFSDVWPQIKIILSDEPHFQAKAAFETIKRAHPGRFSDNQLRTFQRRIRDFNLLNDKCNTFQREKAIEQEKKMRFLILGNMKQFPFSHSKDIKEEDYWKLFSVINKGKKSDRIKAISIIARSHGVYMSVICRVLGIVDRTLHSYISKFNFGGFHGLFIHNSNRVIKSKVDATMLVKAKKRLFLNGKNPKEKLLLQQH